ncbi:PefC/AfrB family outer membrane usher protein [Salmonella enterica]|nr:PefC/AfrB family outer membrane usher protein [Salmonella enterica]
MTYTSASVAADDELNLRFMHGVDQKHAPAILKGGTAFPPGQYVVDVVINNQKTARQMLTITPEEASSLCFSPEWIQSAHLPLDVDAFKDQFDAGRNCYHLGDYPAASVRFDYGNQTLHISEPQVTLRTLKEGEDWDYGIPGFRLRYSTNASKTQKNQAVYYGNIDLNANIGRWVLNGNTSGFSGRGFESPRAVASTAIAPLRGNLELGKTRTRSTLLSDFGFYGASLTSDSSMVPWSSRGYAPVISGVASSSARITVTQNGYTLSSRVVPPGAYSLNDIAPIGNGDLTVTVEEDDGHKTVRVYPVTTLPTLLRAGDFNYNLSVGTRNDDSQVKGVFVAGSLDYGFEPVTLNLASILHRQYQGFGLGLSRNMGAWGALEVSAQVSRSVFDDHKDLYRQYNRRSENETPEEKMLNDRDDWLWSIYGRNGGGRHAAGPQTGVSATVKYAKSIGDKTNLHLLTWRYTGEKYVDFAGFDPTQTWLSENRKERYEAVISQGIGNSWLNLSAWTQSYRDRNSNDSGLNASYSTSLGRASLGLYASYSHTPWTPHDYSLGMNISMPFTLGGKQQYSSTSMNYRPHGGSQLNTSVSGNPTDNLSYNLGVGGGRDNRNASASLGYTTDIMQTGASLSRSQYRGYSTRTSGSVSASGAVMGTTQSGLLFTREQSGAVAVVKIPDIPGVTFNGSRPTGRNGVTALPLSEYNRNDIHINTANVPDDIELLDTVYSVVPTRKAIVFREFGYTRVNRYVLKVTGPDGKALPQGSTALTDNGLDAGFVTNNGLLLSNLLSEPAALKITAPDGTQCRVNMNGVKADAGKLKEVRCE